MTGHDDGTQYLLFRDACRLLNRMPDDLDEFFGEAVEIETVDGQLVVNLQTLLDHIADVATEMTESE